MAEQNGVKSRADNAAPKEGAMPSAPVPPAEPMKEEDPIMAFLHSESKPTEVVFGRIGAIHLAGLCKKTKIIKAKETGEVDKMQERPALECTILPFSVVSHGAGMDLFSKKHAADTKKTTERKSIVATWGYLDVAEIPAVKAGIFSVEEIMNALKSLDGGRPFRADRSDVFVLDESTRTYPSRLCFSLANAKEFLLEQYEHRAHEREFQKQMEERTNRLNASAIKRGGF